MRDTAMTARLSAREEHLNAREGMAVDLEVRESNHARNHLGVREWKVALLHKMRHTGMTASVIIFMRALAVCKEGGQ